MSARAIPCFIDRIIPVERGKAFRKKNRQTPQEFVVTDKRNGRTAWLDVEGLFLPYRLDVRRQCWILNEKAITGDLLEIPEIGGWSV